MIRTRDLLIFLSVLFFVLLGITFTLLSDVHTQQAISFFTLKEMGSEDTYSAEGDTRSINREDIISRLKHALAQNESEVEPSPSVEESEASVSEEDAVAVTPGVNYCPSYDDTVDVVRAWPLSGIAVRSEGGLRVVDEVSSQPVASQATTSSSTPSQPRVTANSRTLLQMPLYPVASGESCVNGEVVGVTVAGGLIYNSEVALYRGYGENYLIGYARDGFPIYGYYSGEVDTCGGYMHATGYRYSITPDRDYVLGCFKGNAASFVGF